MARGRRHAQIAKKLGLSIKTVKMHRGALVKRLGVQTSTEAIRIAIEAGL
jgi:DNA-binding NarL/FixJ family response regulator